jgi:hypothetical protein
MMSFLLFPLHGGLLFVSLAAHVLVLAALIDACIEPARGFLAADKQTKLFWIMALVLSFFVFLVGVVAALVYFLDVRPAVRAAAGGSSGGGSSSDGPYGPYRR